MTPVTATTITDEVTAVMADVVDYDGAAIAGLAWSLGRRALPEHATPPRVVWSLGDGAGSPAAKKAFPGGRRSLLTRNPVLRAVCWGATLDDTNDLASAVLAATQRRWGGRISFQGESWVADPAITDLGEVVTLSWAWPVAVLDRAPSRVTITSATPDTSAAAASDGVLHLGET